MDYDGFGPKRVTSDPKLSLMPNWSPDRRSVVYTTYRHNNQEIVRFELSKGNRRIPGASRHAEYDSGVFPEWSIFSVCFRQGFRHEGEFRYLYNELGHGNEKAING